MAPRKVKYFWIEHGKIIIPELQQKRCRKVNVNKSNIESQISKLSYTQVYEKRLIQQQENESGYYSTRDISSLENENEKDSISNNPRPSWLINTKGFNRITDDYIIIVPNDKVDEYLTS